MSAFDKKNTSSEDFRISLSFAGLADTLVKCIEDIDSLETAIVTANFSKGMINTINVSCDLLARIDGKPYIKKGVAVQTCIPSEMPLYISEGFAEGSIAYLKLSPSDLQNMADDRSIPLYLERKWVDLLDMAYGKKVSIIRISDRVFYTKIEFMDESMFVIESCRVGIIKDMPQQKLVEVYPFKMVEITV